MFLHYHFVILLIARSFDLSCCYLIFLATSAIWAHILFSSHDFELICCIGECEFLLDYASNLLLMLGKVL